MDRVDDYDRSGLPVVGPEYGELVHTFGLAIKLGLTNRQLKSATAAYPTIGSDLGSMLSPSRAAPVARRPGHFNH